MILGHFNAAGLFEYSAMDFAEGVRATPVSLPTDSTLHAVFHDRPLDRLTIAEPQDQLGVLGQSNAGASIAAGATVWSAAKAGDWRQASREELEAVQRVRFFESPRCGDAEGECAAFVGEEGICGIDCPGELISPALPEPPASVSFGTCPAGWVTEALGIDEVSFCRPVHCLTGELRTATGACAPSSGDCRGQTGSFPTVPAGTAALYVRAASSGIGDGTEANPFRSISEAIAQAPAPGTWIAAAAGTYNESFNISIADLTLIGSCGQTRITGSIDVFQDATIRNLRVETTVDVPAITIATAVQASLQSVHVVGQTSVIEVAGTLRADRLEVEGGTAFLLQSSGTSSATVERARIQVAVAGALLTNAYLALNDVEFSLARPAEGIVSEDSELHLNAVNAHGGRGVLKSLRDRVTANHLAMRNIEPEDPGPLGQRGALELARTSATLDKVLCEQNYGCIEGRDTADVTVRDAVIRGTSGQSGMELSNVTATIERAHVSESNVFGLRLGQSDLPSTITASDLTIIDGRGIGSNWGEGMLLAGNASTIRLSRVLIRDALQFGIRVVGVTGGLDDALVDIEDIHIQGVKMVNPGTGLGIEMGTVSRPLYAAFQARRVLIEDAATNAIELAGRESTIQDLTTFSFGERALELSGLNLVLQRAIISVPPRGTGIWLKGDIRMENVEVRSDGSETFPTSWACGAYPSAGLENGIYVAGTASGFPSHVDDVTSAALEGVKISQARYGVFIEQFTEHVFDGFVVDAQALFRNGTSISNPRLQARPETRVSRTCGLLE